MSRRTVAVVLLMMVGYASAEDIKAEERVKVEINLATEHMIKDLKAGARVDLKMVMGKTTSPKGLTVYNTAMVAANVEVAKIEQVEKPETPEGAVKVQLLVNKDLAAKVEKARDTLVTVVEGRESKMKPVPLRLELPMPAKK